MTLAERILNYRAEHHLTQTQMAELLGTNISMIFRIESNAHKTHQVNVVRFSKKLDELEGK